MVEEFGFEESIGWTRRVKNPKGLDWLPCAPQTTEGSFLTSLRGLLSKRGN